MIVTRIEVIITMAIILLSGFVLGYMTGKLLAYREKNNEQKD